MSLSPRRQSLAPPEIALTMPLNPEELETRSDPGSSEPGVPMGMMSPRPGYLMPHPSSSKFMWPPQVPPPLALTEPAASMQEWMERAEAQEKAIKKLLVDKQQALQVMVFDANTREVTVHEMKRTDILQSIHDAALSAEARLQLIRKSERYNQQHARSFNLGSGPTSVAPSVKMGVFPAPNSQLRTPTADIEQETGLPSSAQSTPESIAAASTKRSVGFSLNSAVSAAAAMDAGPITPRNNTTDLDEIVADSKGGDGKGPQSVPKRVSHHFLNFEQRQKALRGTARPRDVHKIDPSFLTSHEPCLIIRKHSILLNACEVKAIILYDKLFLLMTPGSESLLNLVESKLKNIRRSNSSTPAADENKVTRKSSEARRPHNGKKNGSNNHISSGASTGGVDDDSGMLKRGDSSLINVRYVPPEEFELADFEFQALDACFGAILASLEVDWQRLETRVNSQIAALNKVPSPQELHRLRSVKIETNLLETRLNSIRDSLSEVLQEDEDLAHMFLTRLQRFPKLWDQMAKEAMFAEHEEAELILESYLEDVDTLTNATQLLKRDLEASEGTLDTMLDAQRNRLIGANLLLNVVNIGIALMACIFSLFGMNLLSGLEESSHIFNVTAIVTTMGSLSMCMGVFWLMKRSGLVNISGGSREESGGMTEFL